MKTTALLCSLSVCLFFCSCNPVISTQLIKQARPLDNKQDVKVIEVDEALPSHAEVLGEVNIGEAGLTLNCSYEYVLELAKAEARKAGGNALKINEHKTPDFYSSCHRISAHILMVGDASLGQLAQQASESASGQLVALNDSLVKKTNPRMRYAVYGGLSRGLGKIPELNDPIQDQYNKDLKSGYNLGADITYFYGPVYGLGLKCNIMRTANSLNDIYFYDTEGTRYFGDISDDITMYFVGPSWTCRDSGTGKKGTFYLSAAAGYNGYYNRACLVNRLIATGSTLGTNIDMGYDVNLFKHVALALKLSLTTGVLRKMTLNNGLIKQQYTLDKDSYISMSHIGLSVGLSFVH